MSSPDIDHGATVVITHRVRDGRQSEYDEWLAEIGPLCRSAPGHLDWQIVRPIKGLTGTYTIVMRFDTEENLRHWVYSEDRRHLIEKVRPHLEKDDDVVIHTGLDFWFPHEDGKAKMPPRWKQYLVTWSAIYPLVLLVPMLIIPLLHWLHLPDSRLIHTLPITAVVVFLMVYVIMPRYTKLIRGWLYR